MFGLFVVAVLTLSAVIACCIGALVLSLAVWYVNPERTGEL